jgi:hypothetical protein
VCCTVKNAVTNQSLGLITRQVAMTKVCRIASRQARNRVREHKEKVFQERLPAHLSFKPTLESVAALTKRPTEQPVEVQCFNTSRVVRVKPEAEMAAPTRPLSRVLRGKAWLATTSGALIPRQPSVRSFRDDLAHATNAARHSTHHVDREVWHFVDHKAESALVDD